MSKLSFRARALDASKPMPVFRADEIPDLPDFAAINRAVPQMPTGMEKEEECEHHLQRAISAQQAYGHTGELVIPTPEVFPAPDIIYNDLYPANYKLPRQLIHVQPFAIESDIPEYDMDSDDDVWLMHQSQMEITPLKFEEIIERLEKSSGQHVVTLNEAKLLLKEDEDLIIAIYDYWLNKRLKTQYPLIHSVKTERRDGTTNNNPYVAFRRRTEKMQTRKNRKNDEASYEKMLKLRRDLTRAVNLLELVKQREKTKNEQLKFTIDIFDKRYHIGDFSGQILADLQALRQKQQQPPVFAGSSTQFFKNQDKSRFKLDETPTPKRRREYKRKPKNAEAATQRVDKDRLAYSSEDENAGASRTSDQEDEDPDGPYAFKRKMGCSYHAPLLDQCGNWPWAPQSEGGLGEKRYRYCLTSISQPKRCIGFARRRIGRGGRIIFDRIWSHLSENGLAQEEPHVDNASVFESTNDNANDSWPHFRPKTPDYSETGENEENSDYLEPPSYDDEGNLIPVVTISSLSDYVDECELLAELSASNNSEFSTEVESFKLHQQELLEMQQKQNDRLNNLKAKSNGVGTSSQINDPCNSLHSSLAPNQGCYSGNDESNLTGGSSSNTTAVHLQQKPPHSTSSSRKSCSSSPSWAPKIHLINPIKQLKASTLDSESAQFAVSAVLSASE